MREIVTVQIGGFANFIGSHFWNFQDELLGLASDPHSDMVFKNQCTNTDVLYRTGESEQGTQTYTPRLVSIDFQGSLGTLSSRGTLYKDSSNANPHVLTWTGNVSTQVSNRHKKNLFLQSLDDEEQVASVTVNGTESGKKGNQSEETQDTDIVESLENSVHYWTDFSKVHYHPRSLYELDGLWMDGQEFDNYGIGRDVFSESSRGEEMKERLRFFLEECDHIQGIQFIVDDSGGFSSIAADFLENIADEYTNTPVLVYSVRSPGSYMNNTTRKRTVSRGLHDAVSFSRLSTHCKLIVPVGLPFLNTSKASAYLHIDNKNLYHSSAVYAAAIHSISLPLQMEQLGPTTDSQYVCGAGDVNGVIQMLSGQARQNTVAILDVAMPAPSLCGNLFEQSLLAKLQPLTPETNENANDLHALEYLTIHGALGSGGRQALVPEIKDAVYAAYEKSITRPTFSHLSVTRCPLPIPLPFPSIFSNRIGQHGKLLASPVSGSSSRGSLGVHSIPISSRLRSSNAILPFLENRLGNLRKYGIQQGAIGSQILRSWGFGDDELQDMEQTLSKIVFALDPHSETSSDSD